MGLSRFTKATGASPTLLINIGQLLTLRSSAGNRSPRRGAELGELGIVEDARAEDAWLELFRPKLVPTCAGWERRVSGGTVAKEMLSPLPKAAPAE